MSKTSKRTRRASGAGAALFTALVLSACGGGGDGAPAAINASPNGPGGAPVAENGAPSVPAEASSSVAAMMAWAKSLVSSDTAEPLKTNTFTGPLDDTTETSPG